MKRDNSSSSATVVSIDEIRRTDPGVNGAHWRLEAGDDLNVNLVHLDPGSRVGAHINRDVDVVVIVLEGVSHCPPPARSRCTSHRAQRQG